MVNGVVYGLVALVVLSTAMTAVSLFLLFNMRRNASEQIEMELARHMGRAVQELSGLIRENQQAMSGELQTSRQETLQYIQASFNGLGDLLTQSQLHAAELQDKRLTELTQQLSQRVESLQRTVNDMLSRQNQLLQASAMQNEQKLENIRNTVEHRLSSIQEDNGRRLEQMRATVDEKLQKTLEDRISQSFQLVNERLEQVYKGLGEMRNLADGVGDLKKVLSNVKTRGTLGELQLGAILEEILSPEQYEENVVTRKGHAERVEYAVKLPGDGDGCVYLPIDAKFPMDDYSRLLEAYDSGDKGAVDAAAASLIRSIKSFAKDIRDKYVEPPQTTDFGIMFLPVEGLYAEVVRRGMVETLQRDYKVNIAGPTTMAALLNSLQMGFKTLAIQQHSGEVWNVLGAVKTEFDKFERVLSATQQRLNQASTELDRLVGTRTRVIRSKLREVTSLPEHESQELLGISKTREDPEGQPEAKTDAMEETER